MATTLKFQCEKFRLMDKRDPEKGYYAQFIPCVTGEIGLPPEMLDEDGGRWSWIQVQTASGLQRKKIANKPELPPVLSAPENDDFFLAKPRAHIGLNGCPAGSFVVGKQYSIVISEVPA